MTSFRLDAIVNSIPALLSSAKGAIPSTSSNPSKIIASALIAYPPKCIYYYTRFIKIYLYEFLRF